MSEDNSKKSLSFSERKQISEKILSSDPECIPVILEKDPKSNLAFPKNSVFKFNKKYRMNMIIPLLTKNIQLSPEQSIFLIVEKKYFISGNDFLYEIYNKYKNNDGFLHITYSSELVWGN